jgi:hypothetical protein
VSSRARQAVGSLLGVGLVLALVATARSAGPLPRLTGPALAGPTHLHLVVAGAPPYIFDVDANSMRKVPGVVTSPHSVLSVAPSGQSALASVNQACNPCAGDTITYSPTWDAVRIRLDGSVRRLGSGLSVAPARNSSAIWVLERRGSGGHCRLKLLPSSRPSVRAPCGFLEQDGEAGMLESGTEREMLVDTRTGRVRASGVRLGVLHGDLVLEQSEWVLGESSLSLLDLASGTRRSLRWPSILSWLDQVIVQPHGTLAAVGIADPASPGPAPAEDVWILDSATGSSTNLPGFPAQVRLKFSSMAWTSDDRLVLLLEGGGRTVLAVWRPGSKSLPLRSIELPAHSGGSDTFVPLVGR